MIKLERSFTPLCLHPTEVVRLTTVYAATEEAVWNFSALKEALLATSFKKCAYCECQLSEESKYIEVEHFHNKHDFPSRVLEWSNLLPSCKRCNAAKSNHDVTVEPIIDPYEVDPREHIVFRLYRFRAKTALGESTLETLNLNDPERLVRLRFDVGQSIQASLNDARDKLVTYAGVSSVRNRNRLVSHIIRLLRECIRPASYAATAATVLHTDAIYSQIRLEMTNFNIWNSELQELHADSNKLALDAG